MMQLESVKKNVCRQQQLLPTKLWYIQSSQRWDRETRRRTINSKPRIRSPVKQRLLVPCHGLRNRQCSRCVCFISLKQWGGLRWSHAVWFPAEDTIAFAVFSMSDSCSCGRLLAAEGIMLRFEGRVHYLNGIQKGHRRSSLQTYCEDRWEAELGLFE